MKKLTQMFRKRPMILNKKGIHQKNLILLVPLLLITSIVTLLPGIDAIRASFTSEMATGVSLENYRILFRDRAIVYSLNITVLWALCNSFLSVSIGLLLAHHMVLNKDTIFSRFFRKFRKHPRKRASSRPLLYSFLLIPLGIPIYIAVPLWRAFLHGDGGLSVFSRLTGITLNLLTDPVAAFIGALIVSVWINIPLTTFVIHSHLRQVNQEMLDCARLETKSLLLVMRYIQFPLIRTSVFTMFALNFVKAFKEFTLIHLMTGGGVPLVSGITERFIIGSTTKLG
ncbi:MAG: sugar ABC transporter permease, partial [Spirochaetia bacterium]|nr:sugar ABC transporter permease [Spirochaetia bacterium]